jgi:S-adenosylmethionine/arginine decarboxylase-like enzyme
MNNYNSEINTFWGKELILDCGKGNSATRDKNAIRDFLLDLVPSIKMESFGEPILEHFGNDDATGWTAIQLITTSNITIHFCDKTGDVYLNLFSCKDFDDIEVIRKVQLAFDPFTISRKVLYRGVKRIIEK